MYTNGTILTFGEHDTLRPIDFSFRPSQIVYVTLNTRNSVVPIILSTFKHTNFIAH